MARPRRPLPETALGWRGAGLVAAAALAVRFAYLATAAADPTFWRPYLDSLWNLQEATAIAGGRLALAAPFYRAPLYQYVLAGLLRLSCGDLLWVRVAQISLGALAAVLVGELGARLFSRPTGAVAGLLYAGAGVLVLSDMELLNAAVFLPLVAAVLLAFERAWRRPSPAGFALAGVLSGLAALARPDILPIALVAIALHAAAARRSGLSTGRSAAAAAAGLGALALAIAPATLHNLVAGRDFVLISSQGGSNLFVGNNAAADGYTPAMPGPTDTASYAADGTYTDNMESSARYGARLALGGEPRPSEVSRFWARQALAWIRSHPGAWLRLTLRKAFYLAGGFEIGDQKNVTYYLEAWPPFALLPRWWWLFPLALAGLTVSGCPRQRLLLAAFGLTYGATIVAFVVLERYRLALYPAVCVLAARFLVWGFEAARARGWRALLPRLALAASAVAVTRWDPTGYTVRERVESRIARAATSERQGDAARAERLLVGALELDPARTRSRLAYAAFLERHGRLPEARAVGGPLWQGNRAP